jgi:molybdate transport system substrate-binding protein
MGIPGISLRPKAHRSNMRAVGLVFRIGAAALIISMSLAGCATDPEESLTVFAASSLTDVLPSLDRDPRFQFAGSDELALQISEGARADVLVSADETYVDRLHEDDLVEEPVVIATNELVLIVPASNPAEIDSLSDVAGEGVKLVIGAPGVPVGDYTRGLLRELGRDDVLDNVVSNEEDVRAVVGKVALGEADAGIVYATDVASVQEDVEVIPLPADAQPDIVYAAAVLSESAHPDEARAFIELLTGDEGRDALSEAGFGVP